jgi:PEP-CTERM motif
MSRRQWNLAAAVLVGLSCVLAASPAIADGIDYQTTQISGSEWQYTYTLTGTPLDANQAFTIFFDPAVTSNLVDNSLDATDPTSTAAENWLSFTIQYDPVLSSDAFYTALALVDDPTAEAFTVLFDYTGTGMPGSQAFSIDQYDDAGNFVSNLQTGETTPLSVTTPEPSSWLLLVLAIAFIGFEIFRRRRAPGYRTV